LESGQEMSKTSWVELCVSDFGQSIHWFESVLGFRVVARDADEYAELSRGETSLQLAPDHAPYWASERPRLLPHGQRGSGVEIILLVDNVDAVYRQAQQAQADIVRELADYPWHMRQFWVRHPDGYLIRPAQKILSVNPAVYRRQIADAFQRDAPTITQGLLAVKQTADRLARQGDFLGAATIYETLVTEIFEQSHLYYDEEAEHDDYYEEEGYYPEEEGLDQLIGECIEALGNCLADERADRVAREKSIEVLFAIYQRDLHADDSHGFDTSAADQLVRYTTPLERQTIAAWIREALSDEEEEITGSERQEYGKFLLDLQKETLDDETYLRICRETGRTSDLVDRLLTLGRIDEAARETQQVDDYALLGLADLFIQHGQDAVAEHLVRERILAPIRHAADAAQLDKLQGRLLRSQPGRAEEEKPDWRVLEWLRKYYRDRDNRTAELEVAETLFRMQPFLKHYQELRDLAGRLDRWEALRPELLAFLEQAKNTPLLIQIALDEGDIDRALQLLKGMAKKDIHGYTYNEGYGYYGFGDIALQVARAAEEARPREAIELYRQSAERLIALRGRQNYQEACKYLAKMRALYEKLGEHEAWTSYITALREQNRNLRALKEELAAAGL
jgi:catechol 2,3-dioxygenase-like lactoylglutathione lyase family enzyme